MGMYIPENKGVFEKGEVIGLRLFSFDKSNGRD